MIVGSDGVVMIDTLMGPKSAKNAMDALRAASGVKLPVKAIVYTHAHGDHTGGASAYIEYASDKYMVSPLIATRAAIHIGLRRRATPA